MSISKKGFYELKTETYTLLVEYMYYYTSGTYEDPPVEDMEIQLVELNGMDITDFYWDYVDDGLHSQIWEYAQDNKFN